jgi:hypothetical protein
MIGNVLFEMPVEDTEGLAEWLSIAFMQLKDQEGRLIGGSIEPSHAYQIAQMLVDAGLVAFDEDDWQQA